MQRLQNSVARLLTSSFAFLLALVALMAGNFTCAAPAAVAEAPTKSKVQAEAKVTAEVKAEADSEDWIRLRRDAKNEPIALEVAVVRYVSKADADKDPAKVQDYVDLIGAIHVGDEHYYHKLNLLFQGYDALLYELVAPEGTVVEKGRGTSNSNPLGAMQNGMKSMLELEHQLEKVDYMAKNFVHADLSPEEFGESMKKKDEGFAKMYFRMMGAAMAQQSEQAAKGESADMDMLLAMFSNDRTRKLKIALAKQFASMGMMLDGLSGPKGSTLITERNKRALAVLVEQQAAGKRKLGIFYGAGHMNDMHKRMLDEFKLQPVRTVWIEAWDLRP